MKGAAERGAPPAEGRPLLPFGLRDYDPAEAARLDALRERLFAALRSHGYALVATPLLDFVEGFGSLGGEELIRFVDRTSGRMLALRPDITAQVARLVSTRMRGAPRPLRLFYAGSVLRHRERGAGEPREILQVGAERIGGGGAAADAESVALFADCLEAAGIPGVRLDVGHAGLLTALLASAGLRGAEARRLRDLLHRRDRGGIERACSELKVPARAGRALAALADLYGGVETIARAERLFGGKGWGSALGHLNEVARLAAARSGSTVTLGVDLAEAGGLDYYSGIVFRGFAPGLGRELGSGGRYDALFERFGARDGAVGFALNLEALAEADGGGASPPGLPLVLVWGPRREIAPLLDAARALRSRWGRAIVVEEIPGGNDLAATARARGADLLVVALGSGRCRLVPLRGGPARTALLDDVVRGNVRPPGF